MLPRPTPGDPPLKPESSLQDRLTDLLSTTLEDRRLSRGERRAFKEVLADHDVDESLRRQLRNRAFELAGAEIASRSASEVLDWLHDVVKSLDAGTVATRVAPVEQAWFSPGPDCALRIRRLIDESRERLDVCVFTITDDRISASLTDAAARGVAVRLVTDDDKAGDRGSDVRRLARQGLEVRTDRSEAHMHHKYAIADGGLLLTGSYNWTRSAADENEENVLVTGSPALVARFSENFEALWAKLA